MRPLIVDCDPGQDDAPRARDRPGSDEAGNDMTTLKDLKARFM